MTILSLVTPGETVTFCDLPIPEDITGIWAERFAELVDTVSQQSGAIPIDVMMIGETVRLLRRSQQADQMAAIAAASMDLKLFREMAAVAAQANNALRSNLRELKVTPADRSSKVGKQIAGERIADQGGGNGWDGLL